MDLANFQDKIQYVVADVEEKIIDVARKHGLSSESVRRHYVMSTLFVGPPLNDSVDVSTANAYSDVSPTHLPGENIIAYPSLLAHNSVIGIAADLEGDISDDSECGVSVNDASFAKFLPAVHPLDCSLEYQVSVSFVDSTAVYVRPLGGKLPMIPDEVCLLPSLAPVAAPVGSPVLVLAALRNGNCILEVPPSPCQCPLVGKERQRWRRGVVEANCGSSVDVRLADYGVLIKAAKAAKLRPLPKEQAGPPSVYKMNYSSAPPAVKSEMRRFNLLTIRVEKGKKNDELRVVAASPISSCHLPLPSNSLAF